MKHATLTLLLVLALKAVTTAQTPPRRSPPPADLATTQIAQAIDVFEDATFKGGAAKPAIVAGATVRKVTTFTRQARLRVTHGPTCDDPCKSDVGLALFRLMADPSLSAAELDYLQPYSNLLKAKLDIR